MKLKFFPPCLGDPSSSESPRPAVFVICFGLALTRILGLRCFADVAVAAVVVAVVVAAVAAAVTAVAAFSGFSGQNFEMWPIFLQTNTSVSAPPPSRSSPGPR